MTTAMLQLADANDDAYKDDNCYGQNRRRTMTTCDDDGGTTMTTCDYDGGTTNQLDAVRTQRSNTSGGNGNTLWPQHGALNSSHSFMPNSMISSTLKGRTEAR